MFDKNTQKELKEQDCKKAEYDELASGVRKLADSVE